MSLVGGYPTPACFRESPLGRVYEKGDGDPGEFGRVVSVERDNLNGDVAVLAVAGVGDRRVVVRADELARDWRELRAPPDLPEAHAVCCIRCHRINFGPCISATCTDLQVAPT